MSDIQTKIQSHPRAKLLLSESLSQLSSYAPLSAGAVMRGIVQLVVDMNAHGVVLSFTGKMLDSDVPNVLSFVQVRSQRVFFFLRFGNCLSF